MSFKAVLISSVTNNSPKGAASKTLWEAQRSSADTNTPHIPFFVASGAPWVCPSSASLNLNGLCYTYTETRTFPLSAFRGVGEPPHTTRDSGHRQRRINAFTLRLPVACYPKLLAGTGFFTVFENS
ncbi:hypothetical protein E2C01_043743 [Portunus trituberculatus]|uniref:Uncharacterized protein n=1 Tax=Portunus trituberculatus TaxID=210409 RepID=A0A5B7FYE0_PORTR|nr:hypothetical protein [Portunus trituberculatus]